MEALRVAVRAVQDDGREDNDNEEGPTPPPQRAEAAVVAGMKGLGPTASEKSVSGVGVHRAVAGRLFVVGGLGCTARCGVVVLIKKKRKREGIDEGRDKTFSSQALRNLFCFSCSPRCFSFLFDRPTTRTQCHLRY